MIASFILSRTLTPTMADYLLRAQVAAMHNKRLGVRRNIFGRLHHGFEIRFARFRDGYRHLLERLTLRRQVFSAAYLALALASLGLLVFVGQDFFPTIKSGSIQMHMRFSSGTRIEETSKLAVLVDQAVRTLLHGHVVGGLLNCGLPATGINQAYSTSGTIGSQDCDLSVTLDDQASPIAAYQQTLRRGLADRFPRRAVQFPAWRHYRADPELRPAVTHRRQDQRPHSRPEFRLCHETGRPAQNHRRGGGRPYPADHGCADLAPQFEPQPGAEHQPQ